MKKFRLLAALFAIMAVSGVVAPAAQAAPATGTVQISDSVAVSPEVGVNGLHRTWSCLVPSGFTWSAVRYQSACGFSYEYFLLDAVNVNLTGLWACGVPSGYSYSSARQGSNCSASSGSSPYEYLLVKV
ncbi:hypothetical protein [Umezawaea sp. Da 62-37]|uniref:hypothetical protein n=1 Tax=Umezawaea sp. Da 62-37 TaxID=3075927 RepID=UPI0028F7350F|nr:hypothetical protein [Umezawaea sp. Da 62-37]WNV85452.1 hypothetical protein RM788_46265 [Umezawaea sp. Da 62-37]